MRKFFYFLFAAFLSRAQLSAQDPIFLNAQQALVDLNPAFAGSNGLLRAQSSYQVAGPHFEPDRNGLSKISGTYITPFASLDAYIRPLKGGISFSYLHDNQANKKLQTSFFNLGYARHFLLFHEKLKIIPSLSASFASSRFNSRRFMFGDVIDLRNNYKWDVSEGLPDAKKNYYDLSSGLLLSFAHFYIGGAVFHILQPNIGLLGDYKIPTRFVLHASYNLHLPLKNMLYFYGRYERQANYRYTQYGIKAVVLKRLILGAAYINTNTPDVLVGLKGNFMSLQLDYGYNTAVSSFDAASTLQLSLSINIRNKIRFRQLTDVEAW